MEGFFNKKKYRLQGLKEATSHYKKKTEKRRKTGKKDGKFTCNQKHGQRLLYGRSPHTMDYANLRETGETNHVWRLKNFDDGTKKPLHKNSEEKNDIHLHNDFRFKLQHSILGWWNIGIKY